MCAFAAFVVVSGMTHTQPVHLSDTRASVPEHLLPMPLLTSRDLDVIALVVAGHTNAEIALRLGLQLQTLKNVLSSIYDKLGVSTRLQLTVLFLNGAAASARTTFPGFRRTFPACTVPPGPSLSRV